MRHFLPVILLLCFAFGLPLASAQGDKMMAISGTLVDSVSGTPLMHAAVILRKVSDSTMVRSALSSASGEFELKGIPVGPYWLQCSYLGYQSLDREIEPDAGERSLALGTLTMVPQDYLLDQVTIKEDRIPIVVKKDTIEYDAGAFRVNDDAVVEELLKKLPGVEVERDGSVRAMGMQVEEITVDGNPFFGNDPKIATKNLPADIIDKVQVIDKKSDQANFSQMDDGQNRKSINLKLKKDKRKGYFGNVALGGGSDERFSGKVNANRFDRGDQLSLLASGNNINEMNFSMADALVMSGSGFSGKGNRVAIRMDGASSSSGNPGLNGQGINTAWSGGLNFREQLGNRLKSRSYFFNRINTVNDQLRQRENLLDDGSTNRYEETGTIDNLNSNHRINLDLEYQLDSMSTLQIKPTFTFTDREDDYANQYQTKSPDDFFLNDGQSRYLTSQQSPNFGTDLLYRRRFSRRGRTFSAAFTGGYQRPEVEQINQSVNAFYQTDGSAKSDTVNQQQMRNEQSLRGKIRMNYTEPIGRNKRLGIFYEWDRSRQESDQRGYDYNPLSGAYDQVNNLFTNQFENNFLIHEAGLQLQFQKLRYTFTLGASAQNSTIESVSLGEENRFKKSFFNVFPLALFNYSFSTSKRLEINYRTNTRQPSINELQPVPDNRNPQFIQVGNPELKPEFAHRMQLNYHNFNLKTMSSLFGMFSFSATANRIVQSSYIDEGGRQISQPVNASGALNGNGMVAFGLPLKGNTFRMNLTTRLNYERYKNFINAAENITRTFLIGQRVRISYDIEDKLYNGLSANITFNQADYSLQSFLNARYFNYSLTYDLTLELPLGLRLESDISYSVNAGGSDLYNNDAVLLNGSFGKELFKERGIIDIRIFDLLNQNVNINRYTGNNYVEDIRNTALSQYFMLRFRYRWGNFGGKGVRLNGAGGHMIKM